MKKLSISTAKSKNFRGIRVGPEAPHLKILFRYVNLDTARQLHLVVNRTIIIEYVSSPLICRTNAAHTPLITLVADIHARLRVEKPAPEF